MKKIAIIVLLSAVMYSFSGCYGSFSLTSKLHNWNGNVTNSKFGNECIFVAMCIIPVYEICLLGDALIFNSIEFWNGKNPTAMQEGEIEEEDLEYKGNIYHIIKTKNQLKVNYGDMTKTFRYFPDEQKWYQMDGDEKGESVKMKASDFLMS